MQEFLELNPHIGFAASIIAVVVFVLGLLALATLMFGTWLVRTAVGAKKVLGMVATIAAVPGKSGKAKLLLGLMFSGLLSKFSSRVRKSAAPKTSTP